MTGCIAFRMPEVRQLDIGRLRHFRRTATGVLRKVAEGDRLWIREPYFLEQGFNGHKPTSADILGARPTFLNEVAYASAPRHLGVPRYARELLRDWHRRHLLVRDVRREPLQSIEQGDLEELGYPSRDAFAAQWDRGTKGITGAQKDSWAANPVVLRVTFELIDHPVSG